MAGKKILVADDSLTIQKVIRLALSGDGYEIQTVSDGKEAIEQASLFRPDICIIDVSLPHYDAYQIREHFIMKPDLKNIPIILMSSAFEKVDEPRAEKLGFAGHLIKPFDPSHLRSTLLSVANNAPENDPVSAMINDPIVPAAPLTIQFDPPLPQYTSPSYTPSYNPPPASSGKIPSAFQDLPPLTNDSGFRGMDDIQELARNTFEMSGLNQQDWGMIEPGKMEHPFQDDSTFSTTPPASEVQSFDLNEVPHSSGYTGNGQGQISVTAAELEAMVKTEVAKLLEQMNGQIHERVENELKAYAQELMPNLAERIIKEEIHKLLANPPL
jgi:CheY-like chemotaxis protein